MFALAVRSLASRVAMLAVAIVIASPVDAVAQGFVCSRVGPGDTASSLARRLTGDTAAAYKDFFQIRVPGHRLFVPKSQYRHLRTGWQVCVAREAAFRPAVSPLTTSSTSFPVNPVRLGVIESRPHSVPAYDVAGALQIGVATTMLLLTCTAA